MTNLTETPVPPAGPNRAVTNRWAWALTFVSVLGIIAVVIILVGGILRFTPLQLWGILALIIIFLLVGLGLGANGRWYGSLIDSRNRSSLARLQISLWTILSLSAFMAIALSRSMPSVLGNPNSTALQKCRAEYIRTVADIVDLEELRATDPIGAQIAEENAAAECVPNPLKIRFPEELLLALGISTASFTGSTIILSNKRNKSEAGVSADVRRRVAEAEKTYAEKQGIIGQLNNELGLANLARSDAEKRLQDPKRKAADKANDQVALNLALQKIEGSQLRLEQTNREMAETKASLEILQAQLGEYREGLLKVNKLPEEATLADLFQGDEIGDYYLIDLSKVQMFFFTVGIIISYGVALGGIINDVNTLLNPLGVDFPSFSSSLNTLLAISHAGYLTVKSVDHTKTK